ncbi:MAG: hypothetical protein QOD57_2149, partial [Actinomycetota bacterium]|nr:hypothetical protein [Actinomycetota bacterium]
MGRPGPRGQEQRRYAEGVPEF